MKGNIFQIGLLIGFSSLIFIGLLFFVVSKSSDDQAVQIGNVAIWGTMDASVMTDLIVELENYLPEGFSGSVSYLEVDGRAYNEELVDAMAAGNGPDLFMLRHNDIVEQLNKIHVIPYESYSPRRFKETYIEGAEIFLKNDGIVALPFSVDPLVMYWNRNTLSREGVAERPEYWDQFFLLSPKLTKRDSTANILQATIAFGEYTNVTNAKEIVSALIMQTGNNIAEFESEKGDLNVVLSNADGNGDVSSAEAALRFYTEFSNPIKSVYSWNRALNESKQAFLAGDLAFYFGFASEMESISKANPNLNFDIAPFPQIRDTQTPSTFGNMVGIALSKAGKNKSGSVRVAGLLTSKPVIAKFNELTSSPPIVRSLLANIKADAVTPIVYESALISKAWPEPGREETSIAFKDMIESITSGRLRVGPAIGEAGRELTKLAK